APTETLAGEDRAAPTAQPTPAGDESGPVSATRAAQAASAFSLPAFVVTGSGERKALASRDDRDQGLDTSGGLKASPGEQGQGKDQREAQASRELPQASTYTARPEYGQLSLAYGLADTFRAEALAGGNSGPWFGWLQGQGDFSDGGPASAKARTLDQRRDAGLALHAGWRPSDGQAVELALQGDWRAARWTDSALPQPWLDRGRGAADLDWMGQALGADWRATLADGQASLRVPGLGQAWSEQEEGLGLNVAKAVNGHTGSTVLEGGLDLSSLRLQAQSSAADLWQGRAWLQSRFEAWSGSRLGLGLQLDLVGGDAQSMLLGPRLNFDQRLWRGLGLHAAFSTGLTVSRLSALGSVQGQDLEPAACPGQDPDTFDQDPRVPTLGLDPQRTVADATAGLAWEAWPGLTLDLGGFLREDESAFLPDDPGRVGLWTDNLVGALHAQGLRLKQRWEHGGWRQRLEIQWQQTQLVDRPGWTATLMPDFSGVLGLGYGQGPWSGEVTLAMLGPRAAYLQGGPGLASSWDLGARLSRELNGWLSAFVEGRNLLGSPVQAYPDYPDPSPYAGLGVTLRF
ncbi:MAG TPA: hypothetical protein VK842_06810, partial [bacterium]|nr:hypothetical protein [bacterium]